MARIPAAVGHRQNNDFFLDNPKMYDVGKTPQNGAACFTPNLGMGKGLSLDALD